MHIIHVELESSQRGVINLCPSDLARHPVLGLLGSLSSLQLFLLSFLSIRGRSLLLLLLWHKVSHRSQSHQTTFVRLSVRLLGRRLNVVHLNSAVLSALVVLSIGFVRSFDYKAPSQPPSVVRQSAWAEADALSLTRC